MGSPQINDLGLEGYKRVLKHLNIQGGSYVQATSTHAKMNKLRMNNDIFTSVKTSYLFDWKNRSN